MGPEIEVIVCILVAADIVIGALRWREERRKTLHIDWLNDELKYIAEKVQEKVKYLHERETKRHEIEQDEPKRQPRPPPTSVPKGPRRKNP